MTQWSVRVEMDETLDEQQQEAVKQHLPGADVEAQAGRSAVTVTVEAGTLRQAVDTGLRQVRESVSATPVGLDARTVADRADQRAHPSVPELVGLSEIGRILRVSKQRAGQLAGTDGHKDFPKPVAQLSAGPVYARTAIEEFDRNWERRTGRPRKAEK